MNVSTWSIKNPIPALMLFVLLTFGGLIAFNAMKVQNFPDMDLPTISVTVSLPGASPTQLENDVARKVENSIATLQGLKHIYTKVQDGGATITAEFRLEKPTQEALDDVRSAVARVRADLPGDVRDPIITKMDLAAQPVLAFTVASPRMDDEALSWFVDNDVAKKLLTVPGVGAVNRVGGQVHVDQGVARLRVHGGGHHAHSAFHRRATGGGDLHLGPGTDAGKFGLGDFGAPLQSALAHHAEQLGARAHHRTHRGGAGRDHAAVGRQHLGELQPQLLRVELGAGRLHARLGGLLGGGVLLDLLLAQGARGLQAPCALGVGGGFGGVGLGFHHAGAGLGHVGLHGVGGKGGQHLARLDHIAHVHVHGRQAQAVAFSAHAGLLPGGHVAVGRQALGHAGALGLRRGHREGRAGLRGGRLVGRARGIGVQQRGATG